MKLIFFYQIAFFTLIYSCSNGQINTASAPKKALESAPVNIQKAEKNLINPSGKTIESRFNTPEDFERISTEKGSFENYLRNLPLKTDGSKVTYYNGETKPNYEVYDAVVDLEIGKKDLHQCADAIMRLRAEYLWNQKRYEDIHFNFTNGFQVDFSEWIKGRRMVVKGNKTYWNNRNHPSNTYEDFWGYMELIFMYAGTLSLSKELKSIPISELKIGDVFIQGGSPGHAVIVVDVAINKSTNEKAYLLAQSYMPAQEIQILKNPNSDYSPWYFVTDGTELETPEWNFMKDDLKRFDNSP